MASPGRPRKEEVEEINMVEPKSEPRPKNRFSRFLSDPLNFDNYIIKNHEYSYYWHDRMLIERDGFGMWERVDSDNHTIKKNVKIHVDGSVTVGTAILCYARKEDVEELQEWNRQKTDGQLPGKIKELREELDNLTRKQKEPRATLEVTERRY